jgi:transposase
MPRRHELTDAEWDLVKGLLPPHGRGRRWADHRTVINGVCFWAATGVPWRDLPERYGPWQTVYERFSRWRADGTWLAILRHLQASADRAGLIDWDLFCADSTVARAGRAAAGARAKKSPRASRPTTRWGGRAAASARRSTWSTRRAAGCRWGRT